MGANIINGCKLHASINIEGWGIVDELLLPMNNYNKRPFNRNTNKRII